MKKTFTILTVFCCLSLLFSCSDKDMDCPNKFKVYEKDWFNYSVGQQIQFVSSSCQDTIILTITERKISEGAFGNSPEAMRGKCYSYLDVKGTFSSPGSPNNCFDINEEISLTYQRISDYEDGIYINTDTWYMGGKSDYQLPNVDQTINGIYIKNVYINEIPSGLGYNAKYVYYTLESGFLKIDFEKNGQQASFEIVY